MINTSPLRRKLLDLAVTGKLVPRTGEWRIVKLSEICNVFCDGDWIESKDQSNDGIRLIQTGNIGEGSYLDKPQRAKHVSYETFVSLKCTEIYPGDILISRLPEPVGRACVLPNLGKRMITAVDCTIIRLTDQILAEYFIAFTESSEYLAQVNENLAGSTRKRISRGNLAKVTVAVPPLAEQKAIVKRLEELLALEQAVAADGYSIENLISQARDKILELAFAGKLVDKISEWRDVALGDIANVQLGKMLDKVKNTGKPYKYLANVNVRWGSFDTDDLKETLFEPSDVEKFALRRGDLLMCEGGVPGRCAIWQEDNSDIKYQKALHRIRPSKEVLVEYLQMFFEHIHDKPEFTRRFTGSTIHHLPREVLVSTVIPLPSLAEQRQIVAKVDELFSILDSMKGA